MLERLYDLTSYEFFRSRLTDYQKEILGIIGEEGELNKQSLIDKSPFSKTVVNASVEALFFAGLLDMKIKGRQNVYFLSSDGCAFCEYLLEIQNNKEV